MTCKKLMKEDRNGNEALKLLRFEKYTNKIEDVKLEFQRRFCVFHLQSQNLSCFPILFMRPRRCTYQYAARANQTARKF